LLYLLSPYALITTAVSAELGTHPSLHGCSKALATVTSIIDGTGSIGAALGPFLAGAIPGLNNVFYMLMGADVCALMVKKASFRFCELPQLIFSFFSVFTSLGTKRRIRLCWRASGAQEKLLLSSAELRPTVLLIKPL
jgi:hypothetical protein